MNYKNIEEELNKGKFYQICSNETTLKNFLKEALKEQREYYKEQRKKWIILLEAKDGHYGIVIKDLKVKLREHKEKMRNKNNEWLKALIELERKEQREKLREPIQNLIKELEEEGRKDSFWEMGNALTIKALDQVLKIIDK